MRRMLGAGVLLVPVVLASCDEPKPPPTPETATWHRDIGPLMRSKCGGCHVEGGIAPIPLQTYAQAHERRVAIQSAVKTRRMPPWPPARECAEYQHDRSLTDEQVALITSWVDRGAPEGDPADAPENPGTPPAGGLSRVDATVRMPQAYTPQTSPDDYRCFILDWPYTDLRYVTGFDAHPGNTSIVHHIIAYYARPGDVEAARALDDAEPGPGYTCFGGPGFDQAAWLGAWAPGGSGAEFPEGTGLRVEPGSKVVLQVHYNTGHGGGAAGEDLTSVDFKVDETVEEEAFMQPWANTAWTRPGGMPIPAGESDVTHRFDYDLTSILSELTGGTFRDNEPITLHSVALHMHTLGRSARLAIERDGGGETCLLDIPRWDFHWQGLYEFTQPKVLNPGDKLSLECHWDNSAPGAVDVEWGEGTGDEMCLGLFYMTQ